CEGGSKEDWNTKLPQYNKEAEDELPIPGPSREGQESSEETIITPKDPWDRIVEKEAEQDDGNDSYSIDQVTVDSEGFEDEEESEYYTIVEGEVARDMETGQLKKSVKQMLAKAEKGPDLTLLGDQKIQVNLSYLGTHKTIARTRDLIENIIQHYTSVPGQ
ncbi:unnamed protein product, partial [Parnassius apollo]